MRHTFFLILISIVYLNQLQAQVSAPDKQKEQKFQENTVMGEAYQKLWNPAVQARIDEGIERNRKGGALLKILDENGRPIKNASISIQQKTHDFLFGCNAFVLGQLGSPEKNRQYEETFARIFNFATVPVYWSGTEPQQGNLRYKEGGEDIWRRPPVDRFIPFGKKYGMTLKAHPMLWHTLNPDWLPKDPEVLKELYRKRFHELSDRYANDISIWEVTNESTGCSKDYPLFSEDKAYVEWAFREVAPLFSSDHLLMINDYTRFNELLPQDNEYYKQIQGLLAKGLRIQGIGLQFHIWFEPELMEKYLAGERFQPEKMLAVYEAFATLNRPLYITEITVPTPKGKDGAAIQAEVVRNLYRLWFSVQAMAGLTYWNMGDGMAYESENSAASGLVDKEMNPKSSYRVLNELINREWKTNLKISSDSYGDVNFRGFYGKYTISVNYKGKLIEQEINLTKSANNKFIIQL
jgi:GH35 family endo-1,4-beta-xylanase